MSAAPRRRRRCVDLGSRGEAVALALLASLVGCGGDPPAASTAGILCRDPLTKACIACPGVALCVDPVTCAVISCQGPDVIFQTGDAGGGDADVDAAASPDASADALADAEADSADPGDGSGQDAGADVADALVDSAPDAATDVAAVDAPPLGCSSGSKGCYDLATPALCTAGAWQPMTTCAAGWACKAGACACAGQCEAIGQKACHAGSVEAVKSCELDASGCLRWSVPVACAPDELCSGGLCQKKTTCVPACPIGQICAGGACKPDPAACAPACGVGQVCEAGACKGTLSCGQVMACVEQYAQGPSDQLTIDACLAKGAPAAIEQYKARKACIALACQTLIDAGKLYEAMLCVYSKCATEQTTCTGAGVGSCEGLGGCLAGCGNSSICVSACHAQATVAAVQQWYGLLVCGDQLCAGKQGGAFAQCTADSCPAAYQACFGFSGQGGFSCGQILQCAGGCGTSKDCAQQCKAKGSAAGVAALQALLACNDKACGVVCAQGSQAQCDACLGFSCGAELAACQ